LARESGEFVAEFLLEFRLQAGFEVHRLKAKLQQMLKSLLGELGRTKSFGCDMFRTLPCQGAIPR
jgi:hypothetical protein